MTQENKTLLVVFFTVLMDLIGFGIIIPVSPFFAQSLGASPAWITLLGAGYSLMQFLFAPFWGRLSDKHGRRPIILVSIAIATCGYVGFAMATSFVMLFCMRLMSGFGTANLGTAQAIIADCTPPERRARGMGLIGAAFGLGFTLGPAIGGFLGQYGMQVPIFAAAALSGVNLLLATILLPETRKAGAGPTAHSRSPLRQIAALAQDGNLRKLLWVFFVYSAAFSMMEQVLGLFIEYAWVGTSPGHPTESAGRASVLTAYALIIVGITAIVVQGGLIGRLVKRYGEKSLLVTGCMLVAIALVCIPLSGKLGGFGYLLLTMVLLAAGSGMVAPSISSLLSRATHSKEQGHAMGIGQSLSALGRVIGPACAGLLFEYSPDLPFIIGALFIAACAVGAKRFKPVDHVAV